MLLRILILTILSGGIFPPLAFATTNTPNVSGNGSHGFFSNVPSELGSPWTTKARPWLLAGTGITAALLIFEDQLVDPTQKEFVDDKPLGVKWSKIGDYYGRAIPNIVYAIGMLTHYALSKNSVSLRRAEMMTKATLYSFSATSLLKVTVREPRPYDGSVRTSFPSGHSTTAFAFASYVTAEHGILPCGILATGLATLTAASRMNDNKHYLHDVVAGATIGTAYGLGIHYLYSKSPNDSGNTKNSAKLDLIPIYSTDVKGMIVDLKF